MPHDFRSDEIPPPSQETNLFLALRPPPSAASAAFKQVHELRERRSIRGSQRPQAALHVTLLGLGEYRGRAPALFLDLIKHAVSHVDYPPFEVVLDAAGSFRSSKARSPFVLTGKDDVVPAQGLQLALRSSLEFFGFQLPPHRKMTPHMTLLYGDANHPPESVTPVTWMANEFVLIESWSGRTKHVVLDAWPLRSRLPKLG